MYTIVLAAALTTGNAAPGADIYQDIRDIKREVAELRKGQRELEMEGLKLVIAGLRERITDEKLAELRRDIQVLRYDEVVPGAAGLTPLVGRAVVSLKVPAGATFYVNDQPVTLTSTTPTFITPPLEPGRDYVYDFKVTATEDGKTVTRVKRVTVRAGGLVRVNYEDLVAAAQSADRHVPEGTTIELLLLRQKSVQQELKLSPELVEKVVEFTNKQHEAFRVALRLSDEERKQKLKEFDKQNKQFLTDNLTPEQRQRLVQIMLQVTGLHELNRPDVAKALNLTEEQQQKFKELQKEHRKQLVEIFQSREREGRNEKLAKLREDTRNKVQAILTDEQKEKVRELVGEPFKGAILFEEDESEK